MGLVRRIKDRIAHETESHRMSQEHVRKVVAETPFPKGYWRMTDAEIARWRREQRKG